LARHFGRIDFLVNNAGVNVRKPVLELSPEEWDLVIDTNLKGYFLMAQAVVPHMLSRGRGKVINMASILGTVALPTQVAYASSKGGVIQMTKVMEYNYNAASGYAYAAAYILKETGVARHPAARLALPGAGQRLATPGIRAYSLAMLTRRQPPGQPAPAEAQVIQLRHLLHLRQAWSCVVSRSGRITDSLMLRLPIMGLTSFAWAIMALSWVVALDARQTPTIRADHFHVFASLVNHHQRTVQSVAGAHTRHGEAGLLHHLPDLLSSWVLSARGSEKFIAAFAREHSETFFRNVGGTVDQSFFLYFSQHSSPDFRLPLVLGELPTRRPEHIHIAICALEFQKMGQGG
jgi:hypothetical protein